MLLNVLALASDTSITKCQCHTIYLTNERAKTKYNLLLQKRPSALYLSKL